MASIKVKFRSSSVADHAGTLYYQIIHERKQRQLFTDYHVFPSEWDESRSMVTPSRTDERRSLIRSIRERIRWDIDRLIRIIRKLEVGGIVYCADDIVDEFNRYADEYSLFNFMESQIVKLKHNGKIRTAETYAAALNSFRKFRKDEDIMLDCITTEVMEAYEAWHHQRGVSQNTISFYTRILRAAYNRAVDQEIIENRNPFRHVYTGVDKTVKRALPLSVIREIKSLDLTLLPALDFARDMFMMSFMLRGMSFIDMAYLRKSDLSNGYVTYRRRKTGQQLTIKWTTDMQKILDKYPENPTAYLLPIIRTPGTNERYTYRRRKTGQQLTIKWTTDMQKILDKYPENPTAYLLPIIRTPGTNERYTYRNVGYSINHNLKAIAKEIGITIPLTMYVARHSWASAAKAKGIPLSIISEGMGHDSETTTRIYLASLDTSAIDKANSLILSSL